MTCTTRAAETWAHILEQPDGLHMGYAADFATDDGSEPAEACAAVEAVAQQHLDAHPDDHRARRLLGEWLQWHGDVRGEGYAAMGVCGRVPRFRTALGKMPDRWQYVWFENKYYAREGAFGDGELLTLALPDDWVEAFAEGSWFEHTNTTSGWRELPTRRAAEDAAALAFARLPAERREQLLKGEM